MVGIYLFGPLPERWWSWILAGLPSVVHVFGDKSYLYTQLQGRTPSVASVLYLLYKGRMTPGAHLLSPRETDRLFSFFFETACISHRRIHVHSYLTNK